MTREATPEQHAKPVVPRAGVASSRSGQPAPRPRGWDKGGRESGTAARGAVRGGGPGGRDSRAGPPQEAVPRGKVTPGGFEQRGPGAEPHLRERAPAESVLLSLLPLTGADVSPPPWTRPLLCPQHWDPGDPGSGAFSLSLCLRCLPVGYECGAYSFHPVFLHLNNMCFRKMPYSWGTSGGVATGPGPSSSHIRVLRHVPLKLPERLVSVL